MLQEDALIPVLSKALAKPVIQADFQTQQLHGGTLGDVQLVHGIAKTIDGGELSFRLVWKCQKKWLRPGDPDSWRREYDFYTMGLGSFQPDQFRWPTCYHATITDEETQLWLENIEGVSGSSLTIDMLAQAAESLGSFQGLLYLQQNILSELSYLSKVDTMEKEFRHWTPETQEYQFLRADTCSIPEHLRQMLIDIQEQSTQLFRQMDSLPKVLCQKDYWFENIFWVEGKIVLIDWDCVGFGYLGEDIASLVADDTETDCLPAYYQAFVPAYLRGIQAHMDISSIEYFFLWEMMVLKYGYRTLRGYLYARSDPEREAQVKRLQVLYEMRETNVADC